VTFSRGHLTIDLQIREAADGGRMLLGQLSPAGPATVELQISHAPTAPIEVDDTGRFRSHLDDGAKIRLRVRERLNPRPPWIETSWITI
jgi:hypothetical protein